LSEEFDVSRTVVREAIARLKAEGLVESRQGAGAFVARRLGAGIFRMGPGLAEADGALDIFELRLIVEVAAAERAALRRTPEQLEAMGSALARMDMALDRGEDGATADDDFHCAIAAASGNP
jgi:GntR family transcriptional repressor for pyruvate dehydrogenase complex